MAPGAERSSGRQEFLRLSWNLKSPAALGKLSARLGRSNGRRLCVRDLCSRVCMLLARPRIALEGDCFWQVPGGRLVLA